MTGWRCGFGFFYFFSLFICTMSSIMHLASPCRNALTFSVYYEKGKAKKKKKLINFFFLSLDVVIEKLLLIENYNVGN